MFNYFFAESLECPDLRPSQIKSQLCLVILKLLEHVNAYTIIFNIFT